VAHGEQHALADHLVVDQIDSHGVRCHFPSPIHPFQPVQVQELPAQGEQFLKRTGVRDAVTILK